MERRRAARPQRFCFADDDNGIGNVVGRVAPIVNIDDGNRRENQRSRGSTWGWAETEAKASPQTNAKRKRYLCIRKSV